MNSFDMTTSIEIDVNEDCGSLFRFVTLLNSLTLRLREQRERKRGLYLRSSPSAPFIHSTCACWWCWLLSTWLEWLAVCVPQHINLILDQVSHYPLLTHILPCCQRPVWRTNNNSPLSGTQCQAKCSRWYHERGGVILFCQSEEVINLHYALFQSQPMMQQVNRRRWWRGREGGSREDMVTLQVHRY